MIARAAGAVILAFGFAILPSGSASADCREVTSTVFSSGIARTVVTVVCSGDSSDTGGDGGLAPIHPDQVDYGRNQAVNCLAEAADIGLDAQQFCGDESEPPAVVTAPLVWRAFAQQRLPAAQLSIQPPNGRTLVNFDTNFFTERPAFTRVVTLLGQRITLRIEPSSFTWHFDHGPPETTTTPGARYPHLLVTHDYEQEGSYRPRVDTTYTATFRVGGGAWRPVPGSVTITGPTVALQAVEAQPVLTAP